MESHAGVRGLDREGPAAPARHAVDASCPDRAGKRRIIAEIGAPS